MESILETLYALVEPVRESPEEREALHRFRDMLEKVCPDEADEIWSTAIDAYTVGHQDSFCRGFRAGMQIAVEGLQDITA